MDVQSLFVETLDELATRAEAHDEYDVLMAAGLIRKLLLDAAPLVDQVNRSHRLKLVFEIGESGAFPPGVPAPTHWAAQDGLDPNTAPPFVRRRQVTRDELLATVVVISNGSSHSVRDVVLFEANVMGAIHAGSAKEDKDRVFLELNSALAIGGHRVSLRQLKAISRVVLRGLEPLRQAVMSTP
jgi:hypothetical protein